MTPLAQPQPRPAPVVTVLVVLGSGTSALASILLHSNWAVETVGDFEEAVERVRSSPPSVVIAPHRASGASRWTDLIDVIEASGSPSVVIVTDRCTDDAMWAKALNLGAYDVLPQPFESAEVFRVITAAWDASRARKHGH
jgi:DNA-binding response OmpR family regulator